MTKLYKCTNCNKHKQPSEFYIRQSGKYKGRLVSNTCISCTLELKKKSYYDNPEFFRNQKKLKVLRNPEKYREIDRKYRNSNIEICRERSNKSSKEYYERFPEKAADKRARYRARKSTGQPVNLPAIEIAKIRSIYKACKSISLKTGVKHHVDHIIPLAGKNVCGLHVPWNLQVIPAIDNLIKSNKIIEDIV